MITDNSQAKQKGTTNIFGTSFHVGFGVFLHEVFGFGWLVAFFGGGVFFYTDCTSFLLSLFPCGFSEYLSGVFYNWREKLVSCLLASTKRAAVEINKPKLPADK